jgi:hypothetical protein
VITEQDNAVLDKFVVYSAECMKDCARESEKSVVVVGQIIDLIMTDVARISAMSEETLKILREIKSFVSDKADSENSFEDIETDKTSAVSRLTSFLGCLSSQNAEIQTIIMPIVESLQFQDRVRQQMENITKMFPVWKGLRSQIDSGDLAGIEKDQLLISFGQDLCKVTTTNEERDCIRKSIPILPQEESVAQDDFFL